MIAPHSKPSAAKKGPAVKKPRPKKTSSRKRGATSKAKHSENDGGIVALSGFLYQILAFSGLKVMAVASKKSASHDAAEALVGLIRDSNRITHEDYGQDAVVETVFPDGTAEVNLVQFKYSRTGREIAPKEFCDVVMQLVKAKTAAERDKKVVGKCFLVGNRLLSAKALELQKNPAKADRKLSQNEKDFLPSLDTSIQIEPCRWRDGLVKFGALYGLRESEVRDRTSHVVGLVADQTVEHAGYTLDHAALADRLCQTPGSLALGRASWQERIQEELGKTADRETGELVRRTVLADAQSRYPDRALLIFVGPGGTGKTASMHWWAEELARESGGRFVDLRAARGAQPKWMQTLLHQWSNRGWEASPNEEIVERLNLANPGAAFPLLHLSLDGLDETDSGGNDFNHIFALLNWFRKLDRHRADPGVPPPSARLVVSCRSRDEFVERWLQGNLSGHDPTLADPPPFVSFGPFNDEEFWKLLDSVVPHLSGPIMANGSGSSTASTSLDALRLGTAPPDCPPLDRDMVEALRDPSMWRVFYSLDEPSRGKALAGDAEVRRDMGGRFVERFCTKAKNRLGLNKADQLAALRAIARANRDRTTGFLTRHEWIGPAVETGALELKEARKLLDEARSGGLVNENTPGGEKWQWRNVIIGSYLVQDMGGET